MYAPMCAWQRNQCQYVPSPLEVCTHEEVGAFAKASWLVGAIGSLLGSLGSLGLVELWLDNCMVITISCRRRATKKQSGCEAVVLSAQYISAPRCFRDAGSMLVPAASFPTRLCSLVFLPNSAYAELIRVDRLPAHVGAPMPLRRLRCFYYG